MLEYEFFKMVIAADEDTKKNLRATCRIRMKSINNNYVIVDNSTQIVELSPAGKMWLILCCYNISPNQNEIIDSDPHIINCATGEIFTLSFDERKKHVLTEREKEILLLIREGNPSKQIADLLNISVHTVNRHRQNIIEKLCVGNSIEAISAAVSMGLL